MGSENALIIFLKQPKLGSAKTRLAATIGNDNALKVYLELLKHTHHTTKDLSCEKFLYFLPNDEPFTWEGNYNIAYQIKGDLGEKMQAAFKDVLDAGYKRAVIIGSDCYELTQKIIDEAFNVLESKDLV